MRSFIASDVCEINKETVTAKLQNVDKTGQVVYTT